MDDITRLKDRSQRRVVTQTTAPLGLPSVEVAQVSSNMWQRIESATSTIIDEQEKEAAQQRALTLAQTAVDADIAATRLRGQFEYDPSGFESAWEEYTTSVIENTPGEILQETRIALDKEFAQRLGPITNERRSRDKQLAADTLSTKAEASANKLLNMAFDNEMANPEYEAAYAEYASVLQSAANLGLRSQEAVDIELDAFSDRLKAEAIIGKIGSTYETEGYEAAKALLDETVGNENFNFSQQDRAGLMRRGLSVINTLEAEREKQVTQVRSANKAALDLKISRIGTPLEEPTESIDLVYQEIQSADYLTPTEKSNFMQAVDAKLISKLEELEQFTFAEGALSGDYMDPLDKDHRKALNKYFDHRLLPETQDDLGATLDNAKQFIEKTKVVPDSVQRIIRGRLFSGTPEEQVLAADFIDSLESAGEVAIDDFGTDAIQKADYLADIVGSGGNPEEAVRMYQDSLKLADQPAVVEMRTKQIRDDNHAQSNLDYLTSVSDGFDFGLGFNNTNVPLELEAEFNTLQEKFYLKHGRLEPSQKSAWKMVQRVWGQSEVGTGGERVWKKFAPEKILNVPSDKLQDQLLNDVRSLIPNIESDALFLQPDERTDREFSNKQTPTYQVYTLVEGAFEPLMSNEDPTKIIRFVPDAALLNEQEIKEQQKVGRRKVKAAIAGRNTRNRLIAQSEFMGPSPTGVLTRIVAPLAGGLSAFTTEQADYFFGSDERDNEGDE